MGLIDRGKTVYMVLSERAIEVDCNHSPYRTILNKNLISLAQNINLSLANSNFS